MELCEYKCEYYDCDYRGDFERDNAPIRCPGCNCEGWAEFQGPGTPTIEDLLVKTNMNKLPYWFVYLEREPSGFRKIPLSILCRTEENARHEFTRDKSVVSLGYEVIIAEKEPETFYSGSLLPEKNKQWFTYHYRSVRGTGEPMTPNKVYFLCCGTAQYDYMNNPIACSIGYEVIVEERSDT